MSEKVCGNCKLWEKAETSQMKPCGKCDRIPVLVLGKINMAYHPPLYSSDFHRPLVYTHEDFGCTLFERKP